VGRKSQANSFSFRSACVSYFIQTISKTMERKKLPKMQLQTTLDGSKYNRIDPKRHRCTRKGYRYTASKRSYLKNHQSAHILADRVNKNVYYCYSVHGYRANGSDTVS